MATETTLYHPVYHFSDDRLFEKFLVRIPRSDLIDYLRCHESLRNRYFRGFRVSNRVPAHNQLMNAFRKEIIDHSDGKLASLLCALWIRQHPKLASTALSALGIESRDPADANEWIHKVHSQLQNDHYEQKLQALVRRLAMEFSHEDVHIFVSTISYGLDQQIARRLVDEELSEAANDPAVAEDQIQAGLTAAKLKTEDLQRQSAELQRQMENHEAEAQKTLGESLQEEEKVAASVAEEEAAIQALANQQVAIQKELIERRKALHAKKEDKRKASALVKRHREEQARVNVRFKKQISDVREDLDEQLNRVTELTASLEQIREGRVAEEAKKRLSSTAPVTAPSEPLPSTYESSATPKPLLAPVPAVELLGNNAVCYQGIQRIFRNSVVGFLRERFVRLYPQDHLQRMRKIFGEEWEKGKQNALESRQILGTAAIVKDEYDLLGTNHFFSFFDRYYDKLFTPEAGQPANVPKPVKTRFLGNLKSIKDARDPLSHPVEEEISLDEARNVLYRAQEILRWLGCDEAATQVGALAKQLLRDESEVPSVVRRLPSEDSVYLEFVGRNGLLKDLGSYFESTDRRRCLLAGDGGKGKSAAAYRFAQGMPSLSGHFQLIVWLSAKRRMFREGSPATIETPDFANAEEAVDRLLTEYGATAKDMEKPPAERRRLLFEYLNDLPAFVIADDIDTVLDDDEVVSLFTHEIPHTQSAVLLTSRRAIPGIRTFMVGGFEPPDAEEFIKSRIHLYGLNPTPFTQAVISEIIKATDASPLYMDDLMRVAKIVDPRTAIKMWTDKGGDEARKYALQREIETLSLDARKVLIAAAITDDPISFPELSNILELTEDRLLSVLAELQILFLFPKAPVVEGEQRYQVNLNTKKLVRLVESKTDLYSRIQHRARALSGVLPDVGGTVISSLIRQALLRLNAGQSAEAETILVGAIEKYPRKPDLHGVLGYVYKRTGRLADARARFEAAFRLRSRKHEMYLHWMKLEIAEREWSNAIMVADKAFKIIPECYQIIELKVYALRQAGFDLYQRLVHEKAIKMWTEAVEEVKGKMKPPEELPAGERQLNASMYYSVVVCLDMLRRISERNYWLERWEKEHPDDPQVAIEKEYLRNKWGTL